MSYINGTNKRVQWVELWPCKNHQDLDITITLHAGLAIEETRRSFQRAMDDTTRPDGGYKGKMPADCDLLEQFQVNYWAKEI